MPINGSEVKVQVYDTAGQERFKNLTSNYYKAAAGVLVTYDVNDRKTFESVTNWIANLENHGNEDVQKILVASKSDLKKEVSSEEGELMAKKFGMEYLETSALQNLNVKELFEQISIMVLNKQK